MLVANAYQRALLVGSFSAALLLACKKPPERPGPANAISTTAEPRADATVAARCQEQLQAVEPRLPAWRQDITRADAEALADLLEDCRGRLSPALASTLQHWESVELEAAGERGGTAWDILFAHARFSPKSMVVLRLFGRLGRQAVKRLEAGQSQEWRERAVWASAPMIDARSTPSEIAYAAGVIRAFGFGRGTEPADVELADQLALCATLLPEGDSAGLHCALEAGRYYQLLWQAGLCARCGELAIRQFHDVLRRNIGNPEYKEVSANVVIILLGRKQFADAKRLIEKLSQDPKFLSDERPTRFLRLDPLPTQKQRIRSMRSWITYKEALDFKDRGQYARCAQQLSTLTHDDELRQQRPELLLQLGDCYEATGARAQADQAWRDAVAYSPALEIDVQRRQQRRPAKPP